MTLRRHQVLLVGFTDDEARRVVASLQSFDVDFHRIPWSEGLPGFVAVREFDAILLRDHRDRRTLDSLLESLRSQDARSRHAGVLLLAEHGALHGLRRLEGRGLNRVVSLGNLEEGLHEVLLPLLDVARRFKLKAPIELDSKAGEEPVKAYCFTENLSMSGMLLNCTRQLPVGAPFEFALSVPGEQEPIRGSARVARCTDPRREKVVGMGAAFLDFEEHHRARLRGVLLRHAS
jgi:hypothetical protein